MTVFKTVRTYGARILLLLALVLAALGCAEKSVDQLLADAKQARDNGSYRSAILHLKSLIEKSPDHAEARYLIGLTFHDIGDYRSAEIELRKAIDLRYGLASVKVGKPLLMMGQYQRLLKEIPVDATVGDAVQAEVLTLRGLALIGLRRIPEGRELLEQALAKQPEFADALLAKARLASSEGRLDEASQLIGRAVASTPKNIEAWLMKGDLARYNGDETSAAAAYAKVLEISAENIPARLSIASLQVAAGKFDEARKHLGEVRKTAPNNLVAKYLDALIEFRQNNYGAARDTALQVLKTAPNHLPSLALAGAAAHSLGAHEQAQLHLGRVIELSPGSLHARKLLIASLMKSGQLRRAAEVLQPGLQQAPEDSEMNGLAGEVYLQSNQFAKAISYLERAVKLDSKSANARTLLALGRLYTGDTDQGLADLESAVQLDPEKYQADILLVVAQAQRSNYDEALKAMQSLEKKQPKNPLTYKLKAAIYIGKKDPATARRHLEHALVLNPVYVPAAIELAQLDLQEKKPAQARRRLETILERDKNNAEALIALAELAQPIGATSKELIEWLERARGASPGLVQPQLMLARAYSKFGDPKKALEIAQQAQTAWPNNPEVLDTLGVVQMFAGAKEQAVATYQKLVALQPKSLAALFSLAMAQAANAETTAAASTLRRVLALRPDFVSARAELGTLELRAKRYSEAMKIAQQIQKDAAKSPLGFVLQGDVWMAERAFPQAVKAYETAYAMEKNSATLAKLHAAYTQAGRREEGEARLSQRLKESPDDAIARLYTAEVRFRSGNFREAIEHYDWLSKQYPHNAGYLNNLAWAYYQVKDARALETAERAYKLVPDSPIVADTFGWILVEQGNTKRGLDLLQRAVTAAPKASEPRFHLAQALVRVGDRAKAREELQKLVTDSPNSPFATQAKKLLKELPQ